MKPDKDINWLIPVSLIGAAIGAFSYFSSPEAHQRGEGLKVPSAPINYCKAINPGESCKRGVLYINGVPQR